MQNRRALLSGFICSLSYLFGAAVGCVTALLCSGDAILRLYDRIILWQLGNGCFAFLAAHSLLLLSFLLLSASTYGYLLIPLPVSVYGFCAALECSVLLCSSSAFSVGLLLSALIALATIPVLRISALCSILSLRFASLLRSNGAAAFDYRPFARSIWLSMALLFILFLIRCCFYFSIL